MTASRGASLRSLGFAAMIIVLPAITWYVSIAMLHYDGALVLPDATFLTHVAAPTTVSVALYLGWFGLQVILMKLAPGSWVQGVPTPSGGRLTYKLNGLAALGISVGVAVLLVGSGVVPATVVYDELGPLVTTTNLLVLVLSTYIFALGRAQATMAEKTRGWLEAFVVGAALNPRNGTFDWKFFCESRPGMILWLLINGSFAAAQYAEFGAVSNAMGLVCLFQALYVIDYFIHEGAILSTWDIRHEPFGFMLCWGSLVWVPFMFSVQALYLVMHPVVLPVWALCGLIALNMAGYYIFRTANLQKHRFRSNALRPIWGRRPEFIQTARGSKLLVSGWWGIARHANYLGDLMMGLAWCLTCGGARVLTFFYFTYFVILLVHRERRDNDHCAAKYGDDWARYVSRVRWRILPGVY